MTIENPIEEPIVETDAQKIERLESELSAANETVARQGDTIRAQATQKSADDAAMVNQKVANDAALAAQAEQYAAALATIAERDQAIIAKNAQVAELQATITGLQSQHGVLAQKINGLSAQLATFGELSESMLEIFLGNPAFLEAVQVKVLGLALDDVQFRTIIVAALAKFAKA